jgi:hypothetical protein
VRDREWVLLADLLISLYVVAGHCQSRERLLCAWASEMATQVNKACISSSFQKDPKCVDPMMATPKRRRIDEDLKKATQHGVSSGLARSMAQPLRFSGISVHYGIADAWVRKALSQYLVSSWQLMEMARFIGVSSDGKKLGRPAEETNTYACWHGAANLTIWLPSQVRHPTVILDSV